MFKKYIFRIGIVLITAIALFSLGIMVFIKTSPQFGASPTKAHLEKIKKSMNYGDGQFINLIPTSMDMSVAGMASAAYQILFKNNNKKPGKPLPVKFEKETKPMSDAGAKITWYGHSAVLLEMEGKNILIDPMLGNAASPVSFTTKRFDYQLPIDIDQIPKIDAIIMSHDHYDHLDYPSIMKLKDRVGHFYTPLGLGAHLQRWGIDASKITELDWWESAKLGGLELVATPARHFSGRGISDRNKTLWASWAILGKQERIYFSGDSGYGPHFKQIGEKYGPFDFAMMECGQYNEQWEAIHMMPEQTIQASMDVQSKVMMPIHWSAFTLALHSWTDPVERAVKAAKTHEVNIITPQIGRRFSPGDAQLHEYWWRSL